VGGSCLATTRPSTNGGEGSWDKRKERRCCGGRSFPGRGRSLYSAGRRALANLSHFCKAPPRTASPPPAQRPSHWLAARNSDFGQNGSSVRMQWKLRLNPCETAVSPGFRVRGLRQPALVEEVRQPRPASHASVVHARRSQAAIRPHQYTHTRIGIRHSSNSSPILRTSGPGSYLAPSARGAGFKQRGYHSRSLHMRGESRLTDRAPRRPADSRATDA